MRLLDIVYAWPAHERVQLSCTYWRPGDQRRGLARVFGLVTELGLVLLELGEGTLASLKLETRRRLMRLDRGILR